MTTPATDKPAARTIQSDTPCHACGYNLRGLATDGACPECGTDIAYSAATARGQSSAAKILWARFVLAGIALWVIFTPVCAAIVLLMPTTRGVSNAIPRLNFCGPKVWAVPCMLWPGDDSY